MNIPEDLQQIYEFCNDMVINKVETFKITPKSMLCLIERIGALEDSTNTSSCIHDSCREKINEGKKTIIELRHDNKLLSQQIIDVTKTESQKLWNSVDDAAKEIATWPEWMKEGN
jgi:archaellum component FlaC